MIVMRLTGIILIIVVVSLYAMWIRFTMRKGGMSAKEEDGVQVFDVLVKGVYAPSVLEAKVGIPVRINFRREESTDCSRFVNFPDLQIRKELPERETVSVEFTPDRAGEYVFTCDMSMYQGKLIVR